MSKVPPPASCSKCGSIRFCDPRFKLVELADAGYLVFACYVCGFEVLVRPLDHRPREGAA